jgi:hypothetical protein
MHPRRHLNTAASIVYITEISTESEPLLEEPQAISVVLKINYIII